MNMIFNEQFSLARCISSHDIKMVGHLGVLLCIIPIIVTDEDFEKRYQTIQDNLELIGTSVNERNEQINQLQMALLNAQLEEKASEEDFKNFTAIAEKNVRLEKAVTSLKDVIQESGEKIMELELKYQSCMKDSEEKEKKIRSLDIEMSQDKMYKEFFNSVVNQLRNFNKAETGLKIQLSDPEIKK